MLSRKKLLTAVSLIASSLLTLTCYGDSLRPGSDGVFGTADDLVLKDGADGIPGTSDDYIVYPDKNISRFASHDCFVNADSLEKDSSDDKFYWNGPDGLPGTGDDRLLFPGFDGVFGTADDYYYFEGAPYDSSAVRTDDGSFSSPANFVRLTYHNDKGDFVEVEYKAGPDGIMGTEDDILTGGFRDAATGGNDRAFAEDYSSYYATTWLNGPDGLPGTVDDIFVGYPNRTGRTDPGTGGGTGGGGGGYMPPALATPPESTAPQDTLPPEETLPMPETYSQERSSDRAGRNGYDHADEERPALNTVPETLPSIPETTEAYDVKPSSVAERDTESLPQEVREPVSSSGPGKNLFDPFRSWLDGFAAGKALNKAIDWSTESPGHATISIFLIIIIIAACILLSRIGKKKANSGKKKGERRRRRGTKV